MSKDILSEFNFVVACPLCKTSCGYAHDKEILRDQLIVHALIMHGKVMTEKQADKCVKATDD